MQGYFVALYTNYSRPHLLSQTNIYRAPVMCRTWEYKEGYKIGPQRPRAQNHWQETVKCHLTGSLAPHLRPWHKAWLLWKLSELLEKSVGLGVET